jgi:Domain of unknown function (DUF4034)
MKNNILSLLALCTVLSITGCSVTFNGKPSIPLGSQQTRHSPAPANKVPPQKANFTTEYDEVSSNAYRLFSEGKFSELETLAAKYRQSKERVKGGSWKLRAMYGGLGTPIADKPIDADEWQAHLHQMQSWVEGQPKSVTAHVAQAGAFIEYAWFFRGNGYSKDVDENAWQPFYDALKKAKQSLNEVHEQRTQCVHWFFTMMAIQQFEGAEFHEFDSTFQEGTWLEPTYQYLYMAKAAYLLPKWFGQPGDWERFAKRMADGAGNKYGDALYYFVASDMRADYRGDMVSKSQVDWDRVKRGFAVTDEMYGMDYSRLNIMAQLAMMANDQEFGVAMFDRLGDHWDPDIWNRTNFDIGRQWAEDARQLLSKRQYRG